MSVLYLYHVTVQYFPVLDPKKSVFFSSSVLVQIYSRIRE